MKGEAVPVAMPVRENLRFGAGPAHKRIVGRHAPVVANSQRLPDMIAEILRLHAQTVVVAADTAESIADADGDIQRAVRSEQHSPRKISGGFPGVGDQDLLNVGELRAVQTSAGDCERCALRPAFWE